MPARPTRGATTPCALGCGGLEPEPAFREEAPNRPTDASFSACSTARFEAPPARSVSARCAWRRGGTKGERSGVSVTKARRTDASRHGTSSFSSGGQRESGSRDARALRDTSTRTREETLRLLGQSTASRVRCAPEVHGAPPQPRPRDCSRTASRAVMYLPASAEIAKRLLSISPVNAWSSPAAPR